MASQSETLQCVQSSDGSDSDAESKLSGVKSVISVGSFEMVEPKPSKRGRLVPFAQPVPSPDWSRHEGLIPMSQQTQQRIQLRARTLREHPGLS